MTRVLCLSDTHIGAGYDHRRDALADTAAMFDQVADLAEARAVSLVLHAGDVFHRAKPSPAELHVFKRFCERLAALEIPMVAIGGNGFHDAAAGQKSALELFASPLVYVSRVPEIVFENGVTVCTLPAAPLARGDEAVDALLEMARRLYTQAPADRPRVLLAHQMVSGASLPTGLPVEQIGSVVLPLWMLEEIGYDAIVLGDIHLGQMLAPRVWYCGSPMCMDFGEQETVHGVWILNSDDPEFPEFVEIADRRFVTIDVDLTDAQVESDAAELRIDETDTIAASIAVRLPLTDAVVRVRYRATEEQHRRVDQRAILSLLEDAGIHKLYGGLSWEPVRENRARVAEMDESLTPFAAVDLWLDAEKIEDEPSDALRELIGGWLA